MIATERLAFTGGGFRPSQTKVTPVEAASPDAPEGTGSTASVRERQDRPAYNLLLFIFVRMFRPQDDLRFLDPLHLAEVSGTLAVLALVAGRMSRGRQIVTA